MKNITSIPITFEVNNEMQSSDGRHIPVTVTMMHLGLNLNNSIFTKDVVEKNLDTIKNIPILGFIQTLPNGEKDFKGHEYVLTKTENGVERKYVGSAFGLIPQDCNPRWVFKDDGTGNEKEYLQVDGLLWSKFDDSKEILVDDIVKSVSMELYPDSIDGFENEDGNFVFTDFSFDGVCMLGDSCDPAMTGADISIKDVQFALKDFSRSIQGELDNIYTTFTKLVKEKNNNGGIKEMGKTDFTQTLLNQFSDIANVVNQHETFKDRWGDDVPRYYAVDVQDDEVIVVDRMSDYNYFGVSYTMDGDKPVLDFAKCNRKKVRYENYIEGSTEPENAFDFGKHISEIEETAFAKVESANTKVKESEDKVSEFETKVSEYETKIKEVEDAKVTAEANYTQVKTEYDELKPKYDEFVKAEQKRLDAELDAQKDAEFAKYETVLTDNAEFEAIKEKKADMTVKEIESECAILYARKNLANTNFSKNNNGTMTAGIVDNKDDDSDGIFVQTKYGMVRKS